MRQVVRPDAKPGASARQRYGSKSKRRTHARCCEDVRSIFGPGERQGEEVPLRLHERWVSRARPDESTIAQSRISTDSSVY